MTEQIAPPPATRCGSLTQGETGDRNICFGHDVPKLTIRFPYGAPPLAYNPVSPCPLAHVSPRAALPHAHSEFKCSFEEYPCSPSERLDTSNLTFGARP